MLYALRFTEMFTMIVVACCLDFKDEKYEIE